jgi:hypothetical protein
MLQADSDIQRLQGFWNDLLNDKDTGLHQPHTLLYNQLLHYALTLLRDDAQAETWCKKSS